MNTATLTPFAAHVAATYAMADSFVAWRLRDTDTPVALVVTADTLAAALEQAQNSCGHGDTLFILQTHARTEKQTLHAWRIRQAARSFQRVAGETVPRWVHPLKPDPLFAMRVTDFRPEEYFDWSPGSDVVGIERREIVS